jgi:cytochrome c oxidase cbb3-type subunit 3
VSDFTSDFWSYYVAIITVASILACALLLWKMSSQRVPGSKTETMGHVWDENLAEYNNPLPNWWRWLFYITIVFALIYLGLYPGLGKFAGTYKWTSAGQYETEQARAAETFGPIFAKYAAMDIPAVAADPQAREIGQRLFLNYCSQCHASDARGSKGFPNLADKDWLYGGDPATIKTTIMGGRNGVMPPMGAVIGEDGVKAVAHYVMSLSGMTHDSLQAAKGKELFAANCAVCHGAEGKGNQALGAPNLTDNIWLYGGGETTISETIRKGRNNHMPAWGDFLGDAKAHILAAYVWGLSNKQ